MHRYIQAMKIEIINSGEHWNENLDHSKKT